jgi:hypothetical protein
MKWNISEGSLEAAEGLLKDVGSANNYDCPLSWLEPEGSGFGIPCQWLLLLHREGFSVRSRSANNRQCGRRMCGNEGLASQAEDRELNCIVSYCRGVVGMGLESPSITVINAGPKTVYKHCGPPQIASQGCHQGRDAPEGFLERVERLSEPLKLGLR